MELLNPDQLGCSGSWGREVFDGRDGCAHADAHSSRTRRRRRGAGGVELRDYDRCTLAWLGGFEPQQAQAFAEIIRRAATS